METCLKEETGPKTKKRNHRIKANEDDAGRTTNERMDEIKCSEGRRKGMECNAMYTKIVR